ncbi:molybdenum ABC transporter ATP-binding protein [Ideonella sp.]|uniref:molybdenum ABC transporter ATP-binding protein n=1 Tax=Ideonella sp. TaxID=1929293 RepID=UPI0035B096F1
MSGAGIQARLQLARPGGFSLDVALALPGSGVSVLFGPSGCGKTTVLRALAGIERTEGTVRVRGEPWQDDARGEFLPAHRRPIGYVIQEAALFPHLSVADNIAYGQRRRAAAGPAAPPVGALVDLLGVAALMHRRPGTLSGGERQRVAIARALASGPQLLLMDEPLAALDAARKAELLPYLERLGREGAVPIVYVTHDWHEMARLADHLVLMDGGRVRAAGPAAELLSRTDLPLARADDAGVVIDATVLAHDEGYGLVRLGFPGGQLWAGAGPARVGDAVRARVAARDVSVSRQCPAETSILNVLPATLQAMQPEPHSVLLRLAVGERHLLARITRRSADTLRLAPGDRLYAQVKGVALMA